MRPTVTRTVLAGLAAAVTSLLLTGCGGGTGGPVPTGGDITGDTSVIETPTGIATEESTG